MDNATGITAATRAADLNLLRRVIAHARANGWTHDSTKVSGLPLEQRWMRGEDEVNVWGARLDVNDTTIWPASVRQAVDVIVALGVLPVEFSSAYAAGQSVCKCPTGFCLCGHEDELAATEEPDRTLTAPERNTDARIAQALEHIAAARPVVWTAAGGDDPNDEITGGAK